jgi:glycogen operon protein
VLRFASLLVARRLLRDAGPGRQRMSLTDLIAQSDHEWHGVRLHEPDWGDGSHSIALSTALKEGLSFHLILNAYWEPLDFELPRLEGGGAWRRWIDTALDSPQDIVPWQAAPAVSANRYRAEARSVVVLLEGGQG